MTGKRGALKILVAEDEPDIARSYKLALEERGYNVVLTSNGEDCLIKYHEEWQRVRQHRSTYSAEILSDDISHPFHALILDYKMPKIDGIEVAKEIMAVNSHQRIIFASAYVKETLEKAVRHFRTGLAIELMQKPFDDQALVDTIEDVEIYNELRARGIDADALMVVNPPHAIIKQFLDAIRRLQGVR